MEQTDLEHDAPPSILSKSERPHQKHFFKPSLTQANFRDDCDINQVMARFEKTGVLTHVNEKKPGYGDFTGYTDYHQSMNAVIEAQDAFMTIPSKIRAKFNNDPGEFLEFAENPENQEEMVKMGLLDPIPTSEDAGTGDPSPTPDPTPTPKPDPTPTPKPDPAKEDPT